MKPNSRDRFFFCSRITLFVGHRVASEGLIAVVTASPQRVRQLSDMLKETAYSSHRVVWLPRDTVRLHAVHKVKFDAVLMDAENLPENVASPQGEPSVHIVGHECVIIIGSKAAHRFPAFCPGPAGFITEAQLSPARLEKELRHARVAAFAATATTAPSRLSVP